MNFKLKFSNNLKPTNNVKQDFLYKIPKNCSSNIY